MYSVSRKRPRPKLAGSLPAANPGQASWVGTMVSVSRGSSAGRRTARGFYGEAAIAAHNRGRVAGATARAADWLASRSSSRIRSCSISAFHLLERGPKCMRLSLRTSSFRLSISSVWRAPALSVTPVSSESKIRQLILAFAGLLTPSIQQICHARLTMRMKIRETFSQKRFLYR